MTVDEEAVYCRQAVQMDPKRFNAFKNPGVALEGLGHLEEAAHHYTQAPC